MMTSSRPRGQVGGSFSNRRGHASQLSISDPSHHVTEAIGTLYGDEDSESESGRPLSFIGGSYQEQIQTMPPAQRHGEFLSPDARRQVTRSHSDQATSPAPYNGEHGNLRKAQTLPLHPIQTQRSSSNENGIISPPPRSPTMPSLRDVQADPSTSQYTLTNIDNPNDIAQELSNLQALRRMSMDVGSLLDPDMPQMTLSTMSMAPTGDDDEADPSRLLWVPARVHPELAPSEFKSFLETRVQSIRRRSREGAPGPSGDASRPSLGVSMGSKGLSRQKSMLSRQVDSSGGYVDGAERLERKRSGRNRGNSELSLEELVNDPAKAVKRLAEESQGGAEGSDKPILPMAPGGGLRRSTRTQYRKGGSLRSGDKLSSRRGTHRHQNSEDVEVPPMPEGLPVNGLTRVNSEPAPDNFSRPSRAGRRGGQNFTQGDALAALEGGQQRSEEPSTASASQGFQDQTSARNGTYGLGLQNTGAHVEQTGQDEYSYLRHYTEGSTPQQTTPAPEPPSEPVVTEPPPKSSRRKVSHTAINQPPTPQHQYTSKSSPAAQSHSLNEQLASPLPGSGQSRTDNLTFIPTFQDDKKDEKVKKDRDDDAASVKTTRSTRSASSTWNKWFKSGSDDKEKKSEDKRPKMRSLVEKAQDNARLDVIQTSIDKTAKSRSRESLILERDNMDNKLEEERKKGSHRKSDAKKEKDGIFSSIFGGHKKREDRDRTSKRNAQHLAVPLSPPPFKPMEPDVDYHWTRFPLLEERAIYRMAHIKLANPRRPLLSQVLLSNFMYSYLAIVQAMHPGMNVPVSPQQKRLEEEARRKREEEEMEGEQGLDQYDFDYHRAAVQYADGGVDGEVDYVDEAQIYEDALGNDHHHQAHAQDYHHEHQGYGYDDQDPYGHDDKDYYQYDDRGHHGHHNGHEDHHQQHDGRNNHW